MMNDNKPQRELSVEEIISQSFHMYRARFVLFLLPFLVAAIITGVFASVIFWYFPFPATPSPSASSQAIIDWFNAFFSTFIVIMILIVIVSLVISTIATGIVVKCVSDIIEKGSSTLKEGFTFTMSKLVSLLVAEIIVVIVTVIGSLFFIVPGLIFMVMFSLVVPVIIVEQKGVFESLERSRKLVSNRWMKTFVLLIIVSLIVGVVSWITMIVTAPFGTSLGTANLFAFSSTSLFISYIITAFVTPIFPIATNFLYYSMVARELQRMPPPPPPFL